MPDLRIDPWPQMVADKHSQCPKPDCHSPFHFYFIDVTVDVDEIDTNQVNTCKLIYCTSTNNIKIKASQLTDSKSLCRSVNVNDVSTHLYGLISFKRFVMGSCM